MNENGLSLEELATNFETMKHIQTVQRFLNRFIRELMNRAEIHDLSKLDNPEVGAFTEYTPLLAACTYGSQEYEGYRKGLGVALDHHYAKNRHHPEHFREGVNDMNLIDVVEMLCDWKAAGMRHNDGNLQKSIEKNADRFGLSPQLVRIFENTVEFLDA